MEVHHSHHLDHKKKWSEYLLEFLMLFLAVFLGFTAENIREHKIERHREADYIKGLLQNLKDDTTNLNHTIPVLITRIQKLDSIIRLSKADLSTAENLKLITRLNWDASYYTNFTANTATLSQLRSGNLRLIQKEHAADSILKYDLTNADTEKQWDIYFPLYNNHIESTLQVYDETIRLDSSYLRGEVSGKLPPPLSTDKEKLRRYFNNAVALHIVSTGYLRRLVYQLKEASHLIDFLRQVYSLE
jgi:hypothetical protein